MEEQTKAKSIAVTWGLVRHALTGLGAALISWGFLSHDQASAISQNWAVGVGSVSTIGSVVASVWSKIRKKPAAS